MFKLIMILFAFSFLLPGFVFSGGFLKTENQKIINEQGEEVILKGIGLGGWMLQEGYMMQTASFASSQHELKQKISELIGEQGMNDFYDLWLANHCRKIDIDSLARWGFNSVRLPMHYNLFTLPIEQEPRPGTNTWLDKGFELTDSLLSWCAANEIYLILDLHAAPGGQGYEVSISDYDPSKPSLWESQSNRDKTVALWRKLAQRYADEPWIGGYDLINEVNWNLPGNILLKNLYQEITNAIRDVDSKHIIFIEGNWFANDFSGLTPPWDDNMAYSFHKYWNYNKKSDIQWVLDIRNTQNVPLWCGESGENSNVWYTDAIKLFDQYSIAWSWWPMKKIESISGLTSIQKSAGYQTLLDYWNGNGSKPSVDYATTALMELAEKAKLENCIINSDVLDAMMRQTISNETRPFRKLRVPGIIAAVDYDLGTQDKAYFDRQYADYHVSGSDFTAWNNGWIYRNDGVDIELSGDDKGPEYSIGWIEAGEWLKYSFVSEKTDSFLISARLAGPESDGALQLIFDENNILPTVNVGSTGGWHAWDSLYLGKVYLERGAHELKTIFKNSGFNFDQIYFLATNEVEQPPSEQDSTGFTLAQNFPNPFSKHLSGVVNIPFYLKKAYPVKLSIFDVNGRLVKSFSKKYYGQGRQKIKWDGLTNSGNHLASGIYFYRLKAGSVSRTKKMIMLQ